MDVGELDVSEVEVSEIDVSEMDVSEVSVLLNVLNSDFDYNKLENIDNIYIPLKYFINKKFNNCIKILSNKFNVYIYMPTIIKSNYRNLISSNIEDAIKIYNIKGFVISNISNLILLNKVFNNIKYNEFDIIANYTFNIYNNFSINELKSLQINKFTISPELDKLSILDLSKNTVLPSELIVYGKIPLMNINYCLLGKSNKCYPNCLSKCNLNNKYYLKDRLGLKFDIIPDNIQTVTTIYNSKITSISLSDFKNLNYARIDILYENIDEINNIVDVVKSNKRLEGKEFTNGNLNRDI